MIYIYTAHLCEHFRNAERDYENEHRDGDDPVEHVRDGRFHGEIEKHRRNQGYHYLERKKALFLNGQQVVTTVTGLMSSAHHTFLPTHYVHWQCFLDFSRLV